MPGKEVGLPQITEDEGDSPSDYSPKEEEQVESSSNILLTENQENIINEIKKKVTEENLSEVDIFRLLKRYGFGFMDSNKILETYFKEE
jgi:hypothetical protein